MDPKRTIIQDLAECFSKNTPNFKHKELLLTEYLNETWFSDILGWLLNPKASHGYNTQFTKSFLAIAGKTRKEGGGKFSHKKSFLTSKQKPGLSNCAIIREFFLSSGYEKKYKAKRGPRYCDIVLIDFDYKDSLFVGIENKLFSSNHPYQLQEYHYAVATKYSDIKIKDYIYLTINGANPQKYDITFGEKEKSETELYKNWVCISWVKHILPILEKLETNKKGEKVHEVAVLMKILTWFKQLEKESADFSKSLDFFRYFLIEAASECLLEKLTAFNEGKPGSWKSVPNKHSMILIHSSYPKRKLEINMLPNFTITIQSKFKSKSCLSEKIIVPFGAPPDQIFNLINYAAKDIFKYHFQNPDNFMRRISVIQKKKTYTEKQKEHLSILNFAYEHACELKILMTYSKHCWRAMNIEMKQEYGV
jgi:hypothetical protein